jgi:hypothetical protein
MQGQDRILGEGSDGGSDCGHGLVQRLRRLWRFVLHHQRTYQNDYHHDVLCAMVQHASSGWILGVGRDGVRWSIRPLCSPCASSGDSCCTMSIRTIPTPITTWCVPWSSMQGQDRILGEGRDGGRGDDTCPAQRLYRQWGYILHHKRTYHNYSHHGMVCAMVQHAGSGRMLWEG